MGANFRKMCSKEACLKDLKSPVFWRDVIIEGIACVILNTSLLLLSITNDPEMYKPNTTHIGITAAFIIFILVEVFGPLSGGLLNPSVSISLFVYGQISLTKAVVYTVVQTLAAPVSAGLGYLMTPAASLAKLRPLIPHSSMTNVQSVMVEGWLNFILLFAVVSLLDPKNRLIPDLPGLAIGCIVGLGALTAGTYTGGAVNPSVALTPAIVTRDFRQHWIYWVGPILGGILAVLLYSFFVWFKLRFTPKPKEDVEEPTEKKACLERTDQKEEMIRLLEEILNRQAVPLKPPDI